MYWSYIVQISILINLASNILMLAGKKYFLTSQRLVGAGMNRRSLDNTTDLLQEASLYLTMYLHA